ncbi:TrmH family RNA methyltransferase [Jiella sp. M17.18]|uniref:TrmH family RNA methyltransferase n=1 Tax=Jiella sp. M17.18 TaxID=3234247 RepID=UPI0034E03CA8
MPLIHKIDDPADPRVEPFRNVRERDLVGRRGFIAEGKVVLDHLLAARRFRPTALLVLENRMAGLADRLARLPDRVPVHVASRAVFDEIAGFPVHRGILAHAEDCEAEGDGGALIASAHAAGQPLVVCVGIANHDNVGAIFRNAAAFGAGAVLLDGTSCHPLYRKALRVSVGAVLTVPWHFGRSAGEILRDVSAAGYQPFALTPAGEIEAGALPRDRPAALFLGTEGNGLPVELMERMRTVRIAMQPGLDSLNVATAAAIVLHGLYSAA